MSDRHRSLRVVPLLVARIQSAWPYDTSGRGGRPTSRSSHRPNGMGNDGQGASAIGNLSHSRRDEITPVIRRDVKLGGHDDVMQTRSIRGSGEPAWVNASLNACLRLGPDPRRALWPAATPAAQTGRTHDRTRPMLQQLRKFLPRRRRPHMTQSGHQLS
jgi:hypothetical protein